MQCAASFTICIMSWKHDPSLKLLAEVLAGVLAGVLTQECGGAAAATASSLIPGDNEMLGI